MADLSEIGHDTNCAIVIKKHIGPQTKPGRYYDMRKVLDMGREAEFSSSEVKEYQHIPKDEIVLVSQDMIDNGHVEVHT